MAEPAGAINVYTCLNCGGKVVTKNRDEGTTPFMICCQVDGCSGVCQSGFYRAEHRSLEPTHEWFRPTTASERKKLADPQVSEHVRFGGLLMRNLKTGEITA